MRWCLVLCVMLASCEKVPTAEPTAGEPLPDFFLTVPKWQVDCEAGLLRLGVVVSNVGQGDAAAGALVEVNASPSGLTLISAPLGALAAGEYGSMIELEVNIADMGPQGLQIIVNVDNVVQELDVMPNQQFWDHLCCPEGQEASVDFFLTVPDWEVDCEAGLVTLSVVVSNVGQADAPAGALVEVNTLPTEQNLISTPLGALGAGEYGSVMELVVNIADIGPAGLQITVNADLAAEELDVMPNNQLWDHLCCPEEPVASSGEIWGTASANMGDTQGAFNADDPLAPLGERPGGLVWRLDLDTMQTVIVRVFDPELDGIWYLGGLALHPSEPIAYITAFSYDASGGYVSHEWLDGWDTLIALDTDTYQVLGTWDMEPDFYTFTGKATDFVDGADGEFSPGGLQFIDGELYAIEGMTVERPDLVLIDMSSGEPNLIDQATPAYDLGYWGGGVETDSAGEHFAVCSETPVPQYDGNGNEIAWMPEPFQWIAYDLAGNNTCDDALFTFELDRVHGVTLDGDDGLYAVRSTRTHWYEEALGVEEVGIADLQLYTVASDGTMTPLVDLQPVMSSAPMPIDGLGNISWRSQ